MPKQLSTMLLSGAAFLGMVLPNAAQDAPTTSQEIKYPIEVTLTYNATLSDLIGGRNFWLQGSGVQVHGRFYGGLGELADVGGQHTANMNGTGVGLDIVTVTFGPRYTWTQRRHQYALYGQALVGEAFGFNSVFPGTTGATSSRDSLAVKIGAGTNVARSRHVSWRVFEADWLRTQLPNSTNNVQNNLSLGAGLVLRFH